MMVNPILKHTRVLIKGGGDLASGVAYRLKRSGFPLIITELPAPLLVRRSVCFGAAVYNGSITVEGITAQRVDTPAEAQRLAVSDIVPVLVDPQATATSALRSQILIDAIMAKTNTGTTINDAALVVALGPGFTAGQDCHAVIETKRGHTLGRVINNGSALPNTGTPGGVNGHTGGRVLRAPANGFVMPCANIGDSMIQGQRIATVADKDVCAPFDGVLRGLIHPNVAVTTGMKIGDLDPRGIAEHCFTISDKSLAIGGGVLEAILAANIIKL